MEVEPYLILGACNPALAHRALTAEPDLGILLPCNVVVYERDGATHVSAVDAERMLSLVGNDALTPIAADVRERLAAVVDRSWPDGCTTPYSRCPSASRSCYSVRPTRWSGPGPTGWPVLSEDGEGARLGPCHDRRRGHRSPHGLLRRRRRLRDRARPGTRPRAATRSRCRHNRCSSLRSRAQWRSPPISHPGLSTSRSPLRSRSLQSSVPLAGTRLHGQLPEPLLRRLFALLLVGVAAFVVAKNAGG